MRAGPRLCVLFVGLCTLSTVPAGEQQPPPPQGGTKSLTEETGRRDKANAQLVKVCEDDLANQLKMKAAGATSETAVDEARMDLARARHDQALFAGNVDGCREQIRAIIDSRTRQLGRVEALQRDAASSTYDVGAARRRLAHARYRLAQLEGRSADAVKEMRAIARIREDELNFFSVLPGVMAQAGLEAARYQLAYARYRLAVEEGRSDDATRELRTAVAMWEKVRDRYAGLGPGTILPFEAEWSRVRVHVAGAHLATAQRDPARVREHLRQIVVVWEEIARRLAADPVARRSRYEAEFELAWYRTRLALAEERGLIPDEDRWYEFED